MKYQRISINQNVEIIYCLYYFGNLRNNSECPLNLILVVEIVAIKQIKTCDAHTILSHVYISVQFCSYTQTRITEKYFPK